MQKIQALCEKSVGLCVLSHSHQKLWFYKNDIVISRFGEVSGYTIHFKEKKKGRVGSEGVQNELPENVLLWRVDYFELKAFKAQKTQCSSGSGYRSLEYMVLAAGRICKELLADTTQLYSGLAGHSEAQAQLQLPTACIGGAVLTTRCIIVA